MSSKDHREALQYMLHTVVYDTSFSPCGRYLAAGNKFGDVALFSLQSALSPDIRSEAKCPVFTFSVFKSGSIYSLTSTDTLLICAGEGNIQAYKWSDIIGKNPKLMWSLAIPKKGVFSNPEVNSCIITEQNEGNTLYAGAGDNSVHMWDMESGTHKGCLSGHSDYVHSIVAKDKGQGLVSASEDGTARIWDLRSKEAVHIVKPFEDEMCSRPDMGKWLQCLAINNEDYWLLLGGGPTMAAWHLKTLTPAVTFDTPGVAQNVAMFHEDKIFSAGTSNVFNHWTITGDHPMAVPVSPSSVYSLDINTASTANQVMVVAGSSSQMDVCTNFGYTAFSLSFVPAFS
ncbi:THO complex subunit 6 homolog [Aplysia californica]|uniref:THO complex subunit 6 homolog n=1 Tax=Aplysia californica TaxID=6500 RepID=A0ABM0K0Y4_APLCA|nr:THO complex subunit 6 homolog [Aplysia californica]